MLATDPDADRLGVYCKDTKSGEYVTFTGNMSGMLIAEYILREKTAMGTMPEEPGARGDDRDDRYGKSDRGSLQREADRGADRI